MKNKIINFLTYGFGQSINILSPLIIVPFIISICREDGLGKVGISFSLSLILCCIIDYSSTLIGTKEIAINRNNKIFLKNYIAKYFLAKLLITLGVVLLLLTGIYTIPFLQMEKELYIFIIPLLIAQLFNPNWILQGLEKFKLIALVNILSKSIYIILTFLLLKNYNDYVWVNFFLGISSLFFYLITLIFIFFQYKISVKSFNLYDSIEIIKSDFRICLSEFCLAIYQFFPIMIVGILVGNTGAGIFKIIEQIISIFRTYIFMFFTFSYPNVCYAMVESQSKGIKSWLIYHLSNTIIILIGGILIYCIKDYVFTFFKVNQEFYPTVNSLIILGLIIPIAISISQALRQLLFALELIRPYTFITYFLTVLSIALMIFMGEIYAIKGILYSILISEILVIICYCMVIRKRNKMKTAA